MCSAASKEQRLDQLRAALDETQAASSLPLTLQAANRRSISCGQKAGEIGEVVILKFNLYLDLSLIWQSLHDWLR